VELAVRSGRARLQALLVGPGGTVAVET